MLSVDEADHNKVWDRYPTLHNISVRILVTLPIESRETGPTV